MSFSLFGDPSALAPRRAVREDRPDGCTVLRHPMPLQPHARCIGDWLEHWALQTPDAPCLAERAAQAPGGWRRLSWREVRQTVGRLAQGLLDLNLPAGQTATRGGGDGQQLLLVQSGAGVRRLLRVDASGNVTTITDEASVIDPGSVGTTPTRYVYTTTGGRTLRSVLRSGGTPQTLASSPELRVSNQGNWGYETVWYELRGSGGTVVGSSLQVLDSDGANPRSFADTITVGGAQANGFTDTSVGDRKSVV
jgi:hypothetical protein